MRYKDIVGQEFGRLIVLNYYKSDKRGNAIWRCRCGCGNIIMVRGDSLKSGHTVSCRCEKYCIVKHGARFNKLTVIKELDIDKYNYKEYEFLCDCGNSYIGAISRVKNGHVKSCGCLKHRRGKDSKSFKGFEEISGKFWDSIKRGAKTRGLEFRITIQDAWNVFNRQNRKCALSKILIVFGSQKTIETTASLDRIDSNMGYTIDNIQWVHKDINKMKQDLNEDRFINYCYLIARNNISKHNPIPVSP